MVREGELEYIIEYYAIDSFFSQNNEHEPSCAGISRIEDAFQVAKQDFHLTKKEFQQLENLLLKIYFQTVKWIKKITTGYLFFY